MDAARWCFVLICQTLVTERAREDGGEGELEREREKNEKEVFNDCIVSTLQPRKRLALFKCSSACSASSTLCAFPV